MADRDQKPGIDLTPRHGCAMWPECGCDLKYHDCPDAELDRTPTRSIVALCAAAVVAMAAMIWGVVW
jgi:hypothetical protein